MVCVQPPKEVRSLPYVNAWPHTRPCPCAPHSIPSLPSTAWGELQHFKLHPLPAP